MTTRLPIPVHAAARDPATPRPPRILGNAPTSGAQRVTPDLGGLLSAPPLADIGVQLRWLGDQTDDCLAALNPSRYHSSGADELQRFQAGAKARSDTAISIFTLFDDDSPRSVLFNAVTSVNVAEYTSIAGAKLGSGTHPQIADGLDPVDRDLANRLLQAVGASSRWLALSLTGSEVHTPHGLEKHEAQGQLLPLLVTDLGEPVAAFWVGDEPAERVYVLPEEQDWTQTLRWLVEQCLPKWAPNGLRHLRRDLLDVPDHLRSVDEQRTTGELHALRSEYETRLADAEQAHREARTAADVVRDALLYGTSTALVDAVALVLRDAGMQVEDLDARFGDTISADLLVTDAGRHVLVEVKSSNQAAGEDLAMKLAKHLASWSKIAPEPVDRGVLVVNHQLRLAPEMRSATVYQRDEFVETLEFDVVAAGTLLHWWLQRDWAAIRHTFGDRDGTGPQGGSGGISAASSQSPDASADALQPARRPWSRQRRRS